MAVKPRNVSLACKLTSKTNAKVIQKHMFKHIDKQDLIEIKLY